MATEVKLVSSSAPSLTALVDSAPGALNTLNELAAALNDDAKFSTTITNSIATKAPSDAPTFTGNATFDTTTLVVDSSNDRVGIGTASPSNPLHIVDSRNYTFSSTADASTNMAGIRLTNSNNNNNWAGLWFGTGSAAGTHWSGISGARTDSSSTWGTHLSFFTHEDTIQNITQASERLRIEASGKVGIGTTAPDSLLHVDGSNDGPLVTIHQTGGASANYSGLSVETSSTGTNIAEFKNAGTRYARFTGNGRLVLENKSGVANSPNLEIVNPSSSQFNHSIEASCPNLGNGQNNGVFIGKAMSSRNTGYVGYRWYSNNSNDNYIHLSHWSADYLFYVNGAGNYYHAGSAVSDRDLKENIGEVGGTSLDKIINLPIKSFRMKKIDDYTTEVRHQRTGFIAQEVQEVLPDVVTGTDGQKDMGIDPTGIIAHLVRAVTELEARVKELEG